MAFLLGKACQGHFETQAANVWNPTQKLKLGLYDYNVFPQACTEVFKRFT